MFPHTFTKVSRAAARLAFVALGIAILFAGLAYHAPAALAQTQPIDKVSPLVPNSLGLASFNAKLNNKGQVILNWETGSELSIIGFNVWKRVGKGEYKLMNAEMIPAKNMGEVMGNTYLKRDKKVQSGKKYFYQLEVVSTFGYSAFTEAVKVKVK